MQIRDVMTPGVETVGPNAPAREAAAKMREFDIGSLPSAMARDSKVC